MPFFMKIPLNYAFLFRNKEEKTFGTPPKSPWDKNGGEHGYTHMCLFIPAAYDLDF